MIEKKFTVAIVGTNGLPGRYGGWDQLLEHITKQLSEDYSFVVYTSSHDAQPGLTEYNQAKLKIVNLKANGVQSVPYDMYSMIHAIYKKSDLILILGTSGCLLLPALKIFGVKTVLNPDGAEWKRGKWNKMIKGFLWLSESVGVRFATKVVSDNLIIQKHILDSYSRESELIEYGGDNASYVDILPEVESRYDIEKGKYAFKVCRIVPENNIEIILTAFSQISMKLVIIGNWNFSGYGKVLREKFKSYSNIKLLDPIYDQKTLDELRSNCALYVHGHSVGGTNPSLVEAMNLGLNCIVYDVNYNRETTENSALYFSEVKGLLKILREYESSHNNFNSCGFKMKEIATRRYRWDLITTKYKKVFDETLIS